MLTLRLPDGATREVPEGALPRDIVASIGPRLLRDAIAVQLDGEVIDLNTPLRKGGDFRVLTDKDPESLAVLNWRVPSTVPLKLSRSIGTSWRVAAWSIRQRIRL